MGYNTYVTGHIQIVPPIPWGQIKDSPFLVGDDGWPDRDLAIEVHEELTETDEGQLRKMSGIAIVPAVEDRYKAYHIEEHLQEIIDTYGEGREFIGRLDGDGDNNGDMWRLYVRDGKAIKVTVQLVWPDEPGSVRSGGDTTPEAE